MMLIFFYPNPFLFPTEQMGTMLLSVKIDEIAPTEGTVEVRTRVTYSLINIYLIAI